jgi:hypothetical protein
MSSLYEILELSSGEIVLKRSGDDNNSDPLVTLKFSEESIAFLGAARFDVAKAMIEAGLDAATDLVEQKRDEILVDSDDIKEFVLH